MASIWNHDLYDAVMQSITFLWLQVHLFLSLETSSSHSHITSFISPIEFLFFLPSTILLPNAINAFNTNISHTGNLYTSWEICKQFKKNKKL